MYNGNLAFFADLCPQSASITSPEMVVARTIGTDGRILLRIALGTGPPIAEPIFAPEPGRCVRRSFSPILARRNNMLVKGFGASDDRNEPYQRTKSFHVPVSAPLAQHAAEAT